MCNHRKNKYLFILCLLLGMPAAFALPSDKDQPVHVTADKAHLNKAQGVGIFQGHVKLTQGTSILIADTLTLYFDKNSQLLKAVAEGKTANYSTLTDPNKPRFVATADSITYLPPQSQIILNGNAKATQGQNTYSAPLIQYRIDQEMVISPASAQGRTTIIIEPQSFNHSKRKTP